MTNPQDATEVVPYLTSAATIYFIQKNIKGTDAYKQFIAAVPGADKWGHWIIAGVMSLFASVGIHAVWTCALCTAYDPSTGGTALVHFPSVRDMIHGTADWWKVYILQQTVHEAAATKNQAILNTPQEVGKP